MPPDVPSAFFSYCREDSEFALKLAEDLKAVGANVWIDQLDIEPGTPWDRAVEEALTSSLRMLVILSPVSVSSDNVRDEVSFALSKQKRVIPVLYRDCDVPFRLARLQHIDFRNNYTRGLNALVRALGIEQPAQTSATPATAPSAMTPSLVSDAEERTTAQARPAEEERERKAREEVEQERRKVEAQKAREEAEQARRKVEAQKAREEALQEAEAQSEKRQKGANDVARLLTGSLPAQGAAALSQQPPASALTIRSAISLAVLTLGILSSWLRTGFSGAIPTVERDLGLSAASLGVVVSASALTYYVCYLFAGYAMTKFGSRRTVAFGLLLSTFGAAWTAIATNFSGLILSRVVLGAGGSIVIPARCEIFALLPEKQRALTNGLFEFCSNTMAWIVPIFSTSLILAAGWRWMIGVEAIPAAILAATWLVIDRSAHGRYSDRQRNPWLRNRAALGCCAAYIAYTYCTLTAVRVVPLLVQQAGVSISNMSVVSSLMFPVLGASALVFGWFSDRLIGNAGEHALKVRKRFVVLGLLFTTSVGGAGFAHNAKGIYVLVVICFAALGVISSNLWALTQSCAPPGDAAKWGGIQGFCGGLVWTFGGFASMTSVAQETGSWSVAMLPAVVLSVLAAAVASSLIRPGAPAQISSRQTLA